jgi:hypothetical protein
MPNNRKPFIYTQEHKMYGSVASTASLLPNMGLPSLLGTLRSSWQLPALVAW